MKIVRTLGLLLSLVLVGNYGALEGMRGGGDRRMRGAHASVRRCCQRTNACCIARHCLYCSAIVLFCATCYAAYQSGSACCACGSMACEQLDLCQSCCEPACKGCGEAVDGCLVGLVDCVANFFQKFTPGLSDIHKLDLERPLE